MSPRNTRTEKSRKPEKLTETDFAQEKMGSNRLQGHDQGEVRNQRHAVPDAKTETDDIAEGLDKIDKDVRAERDLGKGNRKRGQKD